jgi:hypothetical protein
MMSWRNGISRLRLSRHVIFVVLIAFDAKALPDQHQRGTTMKAKILIAAALAVSFAAPAFAQEFYVVRDATTKKCTIVDKKPTVTTTTVVGSTTYKTRTEAETGMKTVKVCTEN